MRGMLATDSSFTAGRVAGAGDRRPRPAPWNLVRVIEADIGGQQQGRQGRPAGRGGHQLSAAAPELVGGGGRQHRSGVLGLEHLRKQQACRRGVGLRQHSPQSRKKGCPANRAPEGLRGVAAGPLEDIRGRRNGEPYHFFNDRGNAPAYGN